MLRKVFGILLATVLVVDTTNATPIYVDPTSEGSSVEFWINESYCSESDPCTIDSELSGELDGISNQLGLGESWTFDFFDVTVGGLGIATDVDVRAVLAFLSPDIDSAASGNGSFFTFFGNFSGGVLWWDQPEPIDLGDGEWLQISFENLKDLGFTDTTTVSATVSRYVAVPEPGTLVLLGLGLIGLWLIRRRKSSD